MMWKIFAKICSRAVDFIFETIMPTDPLVRRVLDGGISILRPQPVVGEHAGAFYLARYKDPLVKAAILEVKSFANKKIADILGKMFFESLVEGMVKKQRVTPPLVLPIPITTKKKRERGWNQCELILDGFIQADRENIFEPRRDILVKSRENADQVGMTRAQRFENLKNCFSVPDPRQVAGRSVIVFDDILTTGATFGDARRALAEAGASKILCVAIAH